MSQLKVGALLQGDKYKIEKVLGQGGFGITYQAIQEFLDRKVCIKEFFFKEYCERDEATSRVVVLGTQGSREMVERFREKFLKEAKTIFKLEHPNIIRIHDIFKENNTAYYVMDYIEGENLNEMVKSRGALPEAEAVAYVKQVAMALDFIHQRKVNHLDIKPANIMVSHKDNKAILIDFGVSKQYDAQGEQTSTTPVAISHGYAPIEQYKQGGVSTFSPQTDIYALGATLYKLVTGETPPQAMDLIKEKLPPLPSTISKPVVEAIKKAMQVSQEDRPSSISDFLEILHVTSSTQDIGGQGEKQQEDADETEIIVAQEDRGESHIGEQGEKNTNGTDVTENDVEVANKFRKAAEQGNKLAQDELRIRKIRKVWKFIVSIVVAALLCVFFVIYLNEPEYIKKYRQAAEQGDAEAQYKLGCCYYNGQGVNQNYDKAAKWWRKAAEQGDATAQYNLGRCYYKGEGVPEDKEEAAKWYRKAAEQGDASAQYKLGVYYEKGEGVPQDTAEAVKWYRKVAEQGVADVQYKLGVYYEKGQGVPQDTAEAVKWYRKVAEQGDAEAQYKLGVYYQYEDIAEAIKWWRKAADQGNAEAQYKLGLHYHHGAGVPQNSAEAVKWYRKAADQGNADAQYKLGFCFYQGNGVAKNYTEAEKWYLKAAAQGHADAKKNLADLNETVKHKMKENPQEQDRER